MGLLNTVTWCVDGKLFLKSLMLSSLLFVIGCAEQNAEKAVEEIRAVISLK